MGDLKSKMPDLKDLGAMAGKLFQDLKKSVTEIIDDYKAKHKTSQSETTTVVVEEKPANGGKVKKTIRTKTTTEEKKESQD